MKVRVTIPKSLYNSVYLPLLDRDERFQILFGGASSGKSRFQAQRVVRDLLKGGRNYLLARNVGRTIKASMFNEIRKVIADFNAYDHIIPNKSDYSFTCRNGFQALATGLDDVEKVKSITPQKGVLTDIWIEEATECAEKDVKQLSKRLRGKGEEGVKKRITLTFNPILKTHWIYTRFFNKWIDGQTFLEDDDLLILHTTYKSNNFLEPDDIKALEDESDPYFYDVYTLGKWGVLGGIIFTNWEVRDLKNDPISRIFDFYRNGLDFGFTTDPTALNRMYYHRATRTLYITDEYHEKGVTNDQIAADIEPIIGNELVICDSAEPKSIQELCNYGINAVGAEKGKDSLMHGIQWLSQQKIVIDVGCQYTKNEFETYHWQEDKITGEIKRDAKGRPRPVDRNNHHIDDIRYACEDLMLDVEDEFSAIGQTVSAGADW